MAVREHLGLVSAVLGAAAALTGLAYVVSRKESPLLRPDRPATSGALSEGSQRFLPYVEKAKGELSNKSLKQIQVETALTWTGRACASMMRGEHDDAIEYAHEGIEHAALSGERGLLDQVRSVLSEHGMEF